MEITVIRSNGEEEVKEVSDAKLYDVVPEGSRVTLNGNETTRNVDLRDGDEIQYIPESSKGYTG